MTTTKRTGSRGALPPDALRNCPYCGTRRGTRKAGWVPAIVGGEVQGYTCPDCPTWDEPIRREQTGERVRFLAVIRWSSGGKVSQLKRRFDVLEDARAWVAEQRENIKANSQPGGYVDASRLTVDELAERWLAHRRAEVGTVGGIREVTLNGYASSLFSLRQVLGSRVAREVTTDDVEAALRTLATTGCPDGKGKTRGGGLSHRTLSYALGTLRQVFDYAVRRRWLLSNPATAAKPPMRSTVQPVSRGAKRWTASELVQLRSHVDQLAQDGAFAAEPWIPVGMRLTLCGLRRSEVLGLDWSNVDLDAGTVKITASRVKTGRGHATALGQPKKANSYRTVQADVIHTGTRAALLALWLKQGRPTSGLVIVGNDREPVQPDAYSARFNRLVKSAGVPKLASVHNVRHSLATTLQAAGVPDHEAAALLGHDVDTYRRFYLVTDDDGAASAATAAGKLFAV